MIHHDFLLNILLFATGLFAGTVDAIAGGGGLISLPLLVSIGLPIPIALGTNKLQGAIGTFAATYNYYRNKLISFQILKKGLLFGFIGASLGSFTAQYINSALLQKLLPLLMLLVFLYTTFTPKLGLQDGKVRMKESFFYILFGFVLGFYDGFLGPGTGSFWIIALVFFLGYNLSKATAYTKVFNLKSNIIAIVWFMLGHNIDYKIALMMACGQILGGKLGSHLVIINGAKLVRPLFLSVVFFTILIMTYRSYAGSLNLTKLIHSIGIIPVILFFMITISCAAFYFWNAKKASEKSF